MRLSTMKVRAESFDKARFLASVGGDVKLVRELVSLLLECAPSELEELREAVKHRDKQGIERVAHSLKSVFNNFAAGDAVAVATKLEAMGHDGNIDTAEQEFSKLETEFAQLCSALMVFRNECIGD